MTPEEAVKRLIAEIRADRKQRADDLRSFCVEIDRSLSEFKAEHARSRDEMIGLKLVLADTRRELTEARSDIEKQKAELRMVADFAGVTPKAGNGHRGKR